MLVSKWSASLRDESASFNVLQRLFGWRVAALNLTVAALRSNAVHLVFQTFAPEHNEDCVGRHFLQVLLGPFGLQSCVRDEKRECLLWAAGLQQTSSLRILPRSSRFMSDSRANNFEKPTGATLKTALASC